MVFKPLIKNGGFMIKKSFFLAVLVTASCISTSTYSMGTNPFKPIWLGTSYVGEKLSSGFSHIKQKFSKQQAPRVIQPLSVQTTDAETKAQVAARPQEPQSAGILDTVHRTALNTQQAIEQGNHLIVQIKSPETHTEVRKSAQSLTDCIKELSGAATPLVQELNKLMGTNGSPQPSSPMTASPRSEIETKGEAARRQEDSPQTLANDSARKQADLRNTLASVTTTFQAGTTCATAATPAIKDLHSIITEGPSSRAVLKCVAGVSAIFGLGLMGMHYGAGKLAAQAPKFKFGAVALLGGISYLVGDGVISSFLRKNTTSRVTA